MASVDSGGTADRIAARILFKVLRAGSGTPARYSSTFFGAALPFAAEPRSPEFIFFISRLCGVMGPRTPAVDVQCRAYPFEASLSGLFLISPHLCPVTSCPRRRE